VSCLGKIKKLDIRSNLWYTFDERPLEGLGATYIVHLRLFGKLVVDFAIVLIEIFSLGVTAKALRANID